MPHWNPLRRIRTRHHMEAYLVKVLLGLSIVGFALSSYTIQEHNLTAAISRFKDIDRTTYYGQAIHYLAHRQYLNGYDDGTFRADLPVNRAETAKMLLLAAELPILELRNAKIFTDIEEGAWYEAPLLSAVEYGLLNGYADGTIKPEKPINRAEFVKVLTTTFELEEYLPYSYKDVPTYEWYNRYVGIAEKYNLFLYDTDSLSPAAPVSRAEASWALYQLLLYSSEGFVVETKYDHVSPLKDMAPFVHTSPNIRIPSVQPAPPLSVSIEVCGNVDTASCNGYCSTPGTYCQLNGDTCQCCPIAGCPQASIERPSSTGKVQTQEQKVSNEGESAGTDPEGEAPEDSTGQSEEGTSDKQNAEPAGTP
jgi:hypothetical protein